MEETNIVDRLHNWGHWARLRALAGHCGSAEWRYATMRLRLGQDEEEDRRTPRLDVDIKDAIAVERAWVALPPHSEKLGLRLYYVLNMRDPWRWCRSIGVHNTGSHLPFQNALARCHAAIAQVMRVDHDSTNVLQSAQIRPRAYLAGA